MSKSALFGAFIKVIAALNSIAAEVIVWPNQEKRRDIVLGFERIGGIRGVVGAIDGTYIRIKTPREHPTSYTCRKFFSAITLQGICDNNLLFLDCFTGYPGSVADIRIFRNSDIYDQLKNNRNLYLDDDQFIIGDKAYPIETWCLPPYIAHQQLTRRQKNFNYKHAQTRTAIERTWALLFGRYRRLRYLDMNRVDLIPATIIACCVLHNICKLDPDDLTLMFEGEGQDFVNDFDQRVIDDNDLLNQEHEDANERRNRLADEVML